jgi:tetratricopeptide (TPR) repeat protein
MDVKSNVQREYIIIWLDPNHDDDYHKLSQLVHSLKIFSKTDECINYINIHHQTLDEKIFLRISDSLAHDIPILHALPQINSIYVCYDNNSKYDQWIKEWRKVKGVYNDFTSFYNQLKMDMNKENSENNHQDVTFMYSILLNEMFIGIEPSNGERDIFIAYCRKLYAGSQDQLNRINDFERDYRPDQAVQWVTSPCFLYSIFSWVQRTQDIDIFVKMHFFIRDLYRQLKQLYTDSLLYLSPILVVYRGQCMTREDFQAKLKSNVGGLLSIRTFWSTHLDLQMAKMFMETMDPDREYVLLRVTIDTSVIAKNDYGTVYADIHQLSTIPDEQEVLLSPGAVFRIKSIDKDEESWKVSLILTNNHDSHMYQLMDSVRKDVDGPTGRHRLANLLVKMGNFETAKDIYEALLRDTPNDNQQEIAIIHCQLGLIYKEKGDLERALEYYHKTLDVFSNDVPHLASTLSEIGSILQQQGDLHQAMEYHQRALDIELHDPKILALRYANVGSALYAQGKFDAALKNFEQALEHIPPSYPDRVRIFQNIASVYNALESYSIALLYYQTALEIGRNSLWPSHPDNARIRLNLAKTLNKLKCT